MSDPDYRDVLLEEKDKEIARLSRRVEQLMEIMQRVGPHLLPFGRRVDDPPPESGRLATLRFRLTLAARKHPVAIALTVVSVIAAVILALVLSNQSHFRRDDRQLHVIAHNALRTGAFQAAQREKSVRLLCSVDLAVVRIVRTSIRQSAASEAFIKALERATGTKLTEPSLKQQQETIRGQIAPLIDANCPLQERRANTGLRRALSNYLETIPPNRRAEETRRIEAEAK